ncbi:MAG: LPS export ABC transporter permease LptG [Pseudomonadota bacterium]|nr:LPS export ABC transporter permease LptG [Pseudomonadota bacterium]
MTLHLYFAKRFLFVFLGILTVFFLFLALLDLIEQLRRFEGDAAFGSVLQLTLLNIPSSLYEMMPLIVILSSIGVFLTLARSSELVVARAAGRSGLLCIAGPAVVALLIGVVSVAAFNPIVAATSKQYSELSEKLENGGRNVLSIGAEGLWLRQGDDDGQTVIHAARSSPMATTLFDVSFLAYDNENGPFRRITARSAKLQDGVWQMFGVKIWDLGLGGNPEANATNYISYELPSTLTAEGIRDRFGKPSSVSIWNMPSFISGLETAGFSAIRYAVWLNMELSRPVFLLSLVLVGAAFTMRHTRLGNTGISVLTAVLVGFGLYYIRNFAQILGENGQINMILAAWIPPIASSFLALGIILHREDG